MPQSGRYTQLFSGKNDAFAFSATDWAGFWVIQWDRNIATTRFGATAAEVVHVTSLGVAAMSPGESVGSSCLLQREILEEQIVSKLACVATTSTYRRWSIGGRLPWDDCGPWPRR
jgi:hypothetical protein